MWSSLAVRRARGSSTSRAKRSVKIRCSQSTASPWNRRTTTTNRTDRPAMGRSAKHRRYRLWTRRAFLPHPGQALVRLMARAVINVPASSLVAWTTTKPRGTKADGLKPCMALVPCVKPAQASTQTAPKLRQSPFSMLPTGLVDLDLAPEPHRLDPGDQAGAELLGHELHVRLAQAQLLGDLPVREVEAHEVQAQNPDPQRLVMAGQDVAGQVVEAGAAGGAAVTLPVRL